MNMESLESRNLKWLMLLERAVNVPGILHKRFNWFSFYHPIKVKKISFPNKSQWDQEACLKKLKIKYVDFDFNGFAARGRAKNREISIYPYDPFPFNLLFHEMAHIVLEHTSKMERSKTDLSIKEMEAECVAMLCCDYLKLPGQKYSRGYIQAWFTERNIPKKSVDIIIKASSEILEAGKPEKNEQNSYR